MDTHRRDLLKALAGAGALGVTGSYARQAAAQVPETSRIRMVKFPSICQAPVYVAEELLKAEGFTEVSYVDGAPFAAGPKTYEILSEGTVDMAVQFAAPLAIAIDRGLNITILGGIHAGCFELFTTPAVRSIKDLKGRTVCVFGKESPQHTFLASIVTSVGLDPQKDVNWVFHPAPVGKQMLAEGKVDGYLGFPPDPQELRDKKIGRLLLSSTVDKPWSQYFCCMASANTDWVRKHPIAAKRVLRALLKASELCAADPDIGVKAYLAFGHKANPEYARQALRELPYARWRDLNPEETVRFYALRLREAGMVRAAPQKIIAQGTDWRILEELKREMKA